MKPYQHIPIIECGEPLVPISSDRLAVVLPHPYQKLGAPYGARSPFYLRQTVLDRLINAQEVLQQQKPGWRIQIFDAYRPVAVQQFMVDYTFNEQVQSRGLVLADLAESQRQEILEDVYKFWAAPSRDVATPPPHSTGGAVDVMMVDEIGTIVGMGSEIDEISPRSYPDYFAKSYDKLEQSYHANRQLLADAMRSAGFAQHQNEWWHFCQGDQMWAWLTKEAIARYGRMD